jgi:hypothetical protein
MNAKLCASNLVQAVKDLSIEWQHTRTYWHDVKSQEFERTYLDLIPEYVRRTRTAMEEIDALLRKVRHDCE